MPPSIADQIPGGYKADGTRRTKGIMGIAGAGAENQQRTLMQYMLQQVGAKINPINVDIQETYMEWEKKKALQTLLREAGVIKEFTRPYIPKK